MNTQPNEFQGPQTDPSARFLLTRPAGERVLALRESLLLACGGDEYAAHLLNAMERATQYVCQRRQLTSPPYIETSAATWVAELLGICTERTLRRKLDVLRDLGFVTLKTEEGRAPLWQLQVTAVNNAVAAVTVRAAARHPQQQAAEAEVAVAVDLRGNVLRRGTPDATTPVPTAAPTPDRMPTSRQATPELVPGGAGTNAGEGRNSFRTFQSFQNINKQMNTSLNETRAHEAAPLSSVFDEEEHTGHASVPDGFQDALQAPVTEPVMVPAGHVQAPTAAEDVRHPAGGQDAGHPGTLTGGQDTGHPGTLTGGAGASDAGGEAAGAAAAGADSVVLAYPDFTDQPDPEENRQLLLKALGGASRLSELLSEPVRYSNGSHQRPMWLTLIKTERIKELIKAAREKAATHNIHPWTALTNALDAELTGRTHAPRPETPTINPSSYDLKPSVVGQPEHTRDDFFERKFAPGARHREKSTGLTVTIKGALLKPLRYVVSDGERQWEVSNLHMQTRFEWVTSGSAGEPVAAQTLAQRH